MIDVLVDAGILAHHSLVGPERCLTDPTFEGYSITLEPEPPGDFTPEQVKQFLAEVADLLTAEGMEVIGLPDEERTPRPRRASGSSPLDPAWSHGRQLDLLPTARGRTRRATRA